MFDESKFWDSLPKNIAHLDSKTNSHNYIENLSKILSYFSIPYKNSTVIDYGIGNAQLYKALIKFNIKHYIGIDISQRSINHAKKFIKKNPSSIKVSLYKTPIDIQNISADILVCLSTIQHFPSINHCKNFLLNINNSNLNYVLLQIRYSENISSIDIFNCLLNEEFVSKNLSNFNIITKTNHTEKTFDYDGKNYQYLYYKRCHLNV